VDGPVTAGALFLVVAVLGALNTVNGYRPFTRSGRTSMLWQMAGMLTSELPLHAIVWQLVGTAVFVAAGALENVAGVIGLVVSLLSWIGLTGLHRDAQRARLVLDAALREGLGQEPVEALPLTRRQIALPDRGGRKRYCAIGARDLAYGDAGVRNCLDVWRAPDLPLDGRAPVLLQIHGGAWVMGRKDDQAGPLLTHLAQRGWVCVSANYRLSPAATWPDHIVDVKRAIAWVKANIAAHGGDPSFIAVTGGSAGGHLSALAALTANDSAFQPGFEDADSTVQAAIPVYGLFDLTGRTGGTRPDTIAFLEKKVFKGAVTEDASPICRIHPDAPPFMVVHGTNDSFLPVEQARAFAEELQRTSTSPVVYAELPRGQHAFDFFSSVRIHHMVGAIERFLTSVRAPAADTST
jgi:acetyl esterase/lipase